MAYESTSLMFRSLTDEEEEEFRRHARENDPPDLEAWAIYHPVCREEWTRRGIFPRGRANACLIAAAPEMLSVLALMLRTHDDSCTGPDCGIAGIDRARALLAQIETGR
jgi:hypothetical protein